MMNTLAQRVVLVGLARRLRENGSWTGEAHLQKAAYLLRELMKVPLAFNFIFYKHGPYSFGLHDELVEMRAEGLLEYESVPPGIGPRFTVTGHGLADERCLGICVGRYEASLEWIASELGGSRIIDLERLAAARWVTAQMGSTEAAQDRLQEIAKLLGISSEEFSRSIERVERLGAEARLIVAA